MMTIEEILTNLESLQKDYQGFYDEVWQDPEHYGIIAESLKSAIDIIHKYQKIEQIINTAGIFAFDVPEIRRIVNVCTMQKAESEE